VNFSEQPPSKEWAALKYRGEKFAEVWFKPDGEPLTLTFRIPQKSFQIPGIIQQLTVENLLKAVAIAPQEVESWRHGDVSHSCTDGSDPEFRNPLPPPPQDVAHLEIHVHLKPPARVRERESAERESAERESAECAPALPRSCAPALEAGSQGSGVSQGADSSSLTSEPCFQTPGEIPWQDLEARWKAILGLEAAIDTLRISVEGLQAEMEASLKKTLTTEEKIHALRADVTQWNKAKSRVHHALPKMREFIHRYTWAIGAPERKQLEALYKNHIQPQIPCPQIAKVFAQLENLQKDRQILSSQGTTVYHECKGIAADVQNALRTLQSNAAAKARNQKRASGGKFFKQIRRWSGAE
jgi:uncharacterized protein YoxC